MAAKEKTHIPVAPSFEESDIGTGKELSIMIGDIDDMIDCDYDETFGKDRKSESFTMKPRRKNRRF